MERLLVCALHGSSSRPHSRFPDGAGAGAVPKLKVDAAVMLTGFNGSPPPWHDPAFNPDFAANGRAGRVVAVDSAAQTYTVSINIGTLGATGRTHQHVTVESSDNLIILPGATQPTSYASAQLEYFEKQQADMRRNIIQLQNAATEIKSHLEAFYACERPSKVQGVDATFVKYAVKRQTIWKPSSGLAQLVDGLKRKYPGAKAKSAALLRRVELKAPLYYAAKASIADAKEQMQANFCAAHRMLYLLLDEADKANGVEEMFAKRIAREAGPDGGGAACTVVGRRDELSKMVSTLRAKYVGVGGAAAAAGNATPVELSAQLDEMCRARDVYRWACVVLAADASGTSGENGASGVHVGGSSGDRAAPTPAAAAAADPALQAGLGAILTKLDATGVSRRDAKLLLLEGAQLFEAVLKSACRNRKIAVTHPPTLGVLLNAVTNQANAAPSPFDRQLQATLSAMVRARNEAAHHGTEQDPSRVRAFVVACRTALGVLELNQYFATATGGGGGGGSGSGSGSSNTHSSQGGGVGGRVSGRQGTSTSTSSDRGSGIGGCSDSDGDVSGNEGVGDGGSDGAAGVGGRSNGRLDTCITYTFWCGGAVVVYALAEYYYYTVIVPSQLESGGDRAEL